MWRKVLLQGRAAEMFEYTLQFAPTEIWEASETFTRFCFLGMSAMVPFSSSSVARLLTEPQQRLMAEV